jgi:hypothetical protein
LKVSFRLKYSCREEAHIGRILYLLDHPIVRVHIVVGKVLRFDLQRHTLGFPRLQVYTRKSLEFLRGAVDLRAAATYIELDDLIARHLTLVAHVYRYLDEAAFTYLLIAQAQVVVAVSRIAQAEPEGEGGLEALLIEEAVAMVITVFDTLGLLIEVGELPGVFREDDGELPAGVYLSEQNVRYGVSALHSRIPGHEDGLGLVLPALHGDGGAALQHHHQVVRLLRDGLDELQVRLAQAEVLAVSTNFDRAGHGLSLILSSQA